MKMKNQNIILISVALLLAIASHQTLGKKIHRSLMLSKYWKILLRRVYTSRLRMRLLHCVPFLYYLPWFVDAYRKKVITTKTHAENACRKRMRKTHAETGCGNLALGVIQE